MSKKKTLSPFIVVMTIFVCFLSLYLVTPTIYETLKTKQYKDSFVELVNDLKKSEDIESTIIKYSIENDAIVSVKNTETNQSTETPIIKTARSHQEKAMIQTNMGQSIQLNVIYTFASLSDINAILIILLPTLGLVTLILYLFGNVTFTNKKEVLKEYYSITEDMLRLKPKARLPLSHEKKDVAKNINDLYELLLDKQEQLNSVNKDYQLLLDASNETINSLKHDINDDINEILFDVKKMINDPLKYKNNVVYLMEIKMKLEAILSNKEKSKSLPNTIHEIFYQLFAPYTYMLQEKQVNIVYDLQENFRVKVDDLLFTQAINHLMTFIMNQCDDKSQITIKQEDYDISIQYQGDCLTEDSIQQVESLDVDVKAAYRYITQAGFFINFKQKEEKDGMQFVFHF